MRPAPRSAGSCAALAPRVWARLPLALALLGASACTQERMVLPPSKPISREVYLAEWGVLMRGDRGGRGENLPFAERPLREGRHLSMGLLSVPPRGLQSPPAQPRDELLLIVEGQGRLELQGGAQRSWRLEPGSLAFLPAGSRGRLHGGQEAPLRGLLVYPGVGTQPAAEGTARPAPVAPRLLGIEDYMTPQVLDHKQPGYVRVLGALPGSVSVSIVSVRGNEGRGVHLHHDKALLFLQGKGLLGAGSEGLGEGKDSKLKRGYLTYPVRPQTLVFLPARSPHEFGNRAERTVYLAFYGPDFAGKDRYRVKNLTPEEEARARRPAGRKSALGSGK